MRLLMIFWILLLSGCATPAGMNARTWVRAEHKRSYEPVEAKEFKVEDKSLSISYTPNIVDAGTSFVFLNKTDQVLKLIWDETAYVDWRGQTERIFHSGVKLADRSQSQPPSMVAPKSSLSDDLIPIGNVDFNGQIWKYSPLCGTVNFMGHLTQDEECLNKTLGYLITYELNGKKNTLMVKFKYTGKEPIKAPPKVTP